MNYVLLGPSGLRVSELCFGAGTFAEPWGSDEAESRRVLDAFLDRGGNFVDTANKYAGGLSEEYLGRFLEGRRDSVVVGTKYTGATADDDPNAAGNARKNLRRSLELSLRRLRTDHVDVLWVHVWDQVTS